MFGNLFSKNTTFKFELTPDQDEFLAAAIELYNQTLKEFNERYNITKYAWGFDQETAKFQLKKNEKVKYEADGQIIGSYSKSEGSWEWAWNNPNIESSVSKDSLKVKKYGEKEDLRYFCEGSLSIENENYAAYLAAVGQKLSGAAVTYRGAMGDLSIYILLNNLTEING